jgi:uncharacterized protein YutE (UPF0331/DUF86 family)
MLINGVIENKLRLLEQKLDDIRGWGIVDYEEFRTSSLKTNAVERALTVCVEIMIDVSERILAIKKMPPNNTSVDNFLELQTLGIIETHEPYAAMIRFRNFIVHRYERIDTRILFDIVTRKMDAFPQFVHEIRTALGTRQ